MLKYSVVFLGVATAAAVLGFSGAAASAAWIAQTLFFVFLALFLALIVAGFAREPT